MLKADADTLEQWGAGNPWTLETAVSSLIVGAVQEARALRVHLVATETTVRTVATPDC